MSDLYPFDPDVRDHVAGLLYELLPSLYRARDGERGELRRFLRVLAAPLAELRQNIEELHGDLFIDTCNDWIIPYIADMVGATLIFPDAPSNRRDVRGTVGWRRRKGTRGALEEMGSDLSGQAVVTHEGWQRLLIVQDLNLPRPERAVTDLRPAALAESASGPLDAAFHAVDLRSISATSGRYHPQHVVHWTHPTQLFPVREGVASERTRRDVNGAVTDPDLRYAVHPLGLMSALRVRRAHPRDPMPTDRVPAMHFAASPGAYFDQEGRTAGRFCARIAGLPAAVAAPAREPRQPSRATARGAILAGEVAVTLLEEPLDRLTAAVRLEIFSASIDPLTALPGVGGAAWRGGALVPVRAPSAPINDVAPPAAHPIPAAMIRIRPAAPGAGAYFPGAIVELASDAVDALHASEDPVLRAHGFLRGALLVEVPATWVRADRWLYLAADGSAYDAQSAAARESGAAPDLPVEIDPGGKVSLTGEALTVGPGPAWPPLPRTAADGRMRRVPSAPDRGPVILRAGKVRRSNAGALEEIVTSPRMALCFAARIARGGPAQIEPFLRLSWTGEEPTGDAFEVLSASGAPIAAAAARSARFRDVALAREQSPADIELVVRFEAEEPELVLPPCEVSFTADDGQTILIHLPELATLDSGAPISSDWAPSPAPHPHPSLPVAVGEDGATYFVGGTGVARYALGQVAPLRAPTLRRRRVRQRTLCGWTREEPLALPPKMLAPTPRGALDVDPEHGLFALAKDEPPPPFPASPGGFRPSAVTVDYLEGYSDHIGARPDVREPILNRRLPAPTRIVSASGRLHPGAPAGWHVIPRYTSLADALAAVAAGPGGEEVIQFEDSATYACPSGLTWPVPPGGGAGALDLTLQAAESQRPTILLGAPWGAAPGARYARVVARGLAVRGGVVRFPEADRVDLELCTTEALELDAPPDGDPILRVERCVTGRLTLIGPGTLSVRDSVIDGDPLAIAAPDGVVELERVTAMSPEGGLGTQARAIEASHAIFLGRVVVADRFHGCVRYSRAPGDSVLPRKHRVHAAPVRFVSRDRDDPAHARLAPDAARELVVGAEDGSEQGAFHGVRLAQRQEALARRLVEFTPAGLVTGIVRKD